MQPVRWPADPELEWCPPGHGDIYTALAASGTLDALLGAGLRYAFVSNSDNLGALADVRVAAWLAARQVPFALEAVRGTAADRKGGHLARCQGRVVLRETAQVPDGDTSPTSSAGAGTTPTTSGLTCARSRTCRPPTRRRRLCH
jgi:UTP--glucose-1-phosphate uridylyltransferase